MNWLIKEIKKFLGLASDVDELSIHEQDTEETAAATPAEPCPSDEKLAKMRMPELRGLAASRDLGDGRYKGLDRAQLTKLIKQSY